MFKLNCAILDDESRAIRAIEYMIDICKHPIIHLNVIKTSHSPSELLNTDFLSQIDVLFLDIKLADLNGLTLYKELNNVQTKIVIVSAYDDFVLDAIKVSVFDYLLKPVEKSDFLEMMNKLATHFERSFKQLTELIYFSQALDINAINEPIQTHLSRVNETILTDIKKNHPQLTQSDHRLLSLLFLGLSTKEIASHLHIEPESVKKAKFRLRKKMGLLKNESLEDLFR